MLHRRLSHYTGERGLGQGDLGVTALELGNARLEMRARTGELENGTLIDNADSIAFARAYLERQQDVGR